VSDALVPQSNSVKAAGGLAPSGGYSPAQLRQAYGFNQISFGSIKGDGTGQTIALIDAYDDPNIAGDLAAFDSALGIPAPPSFKKVNQTGGMSYPTVDANWGLETSLDVEWAHGMAPGANILLVEANTPSITDLFAAVDYARNQPGVSVVSMSWGARESSGEASFDSRFSTPSGHAGVTFVASSGDSGSSGAPEFPSVAPQVLSVGGTYIQLDSSGNYQSETGWSGSGGGISVTETQPGYQKGVVTQSSTMRTTPDVAYNAGSSMAVYDSLVYPGWINVGGTSAGAPQWAALVAIADQGRALSGQSSLDGYTQTLPKLYQLPQSDFHDLTSGSNGGYSATTGYDLVTGRGTPYANLVVAGLTGAPPSNSGPPVSSSPPSNPGPPSSSGPSLAAPASATPNPVTGISTTLRVLGADPAGESTLTYTWTVMSEPAGATAPTYSGNGTNAAKSTTATFFQAGNYTFQVTLRDASGSTTTSNVNVTVNQTFTSIRVSPGGGTVMENGSQQFTATTRDQFGQAMAAQPGSFTWSLGAGSVGTLSSTGLYQASATTGTATIMARYMMSGSATVTVTAQASTIPAAPTNLVASAISKTQINISWSESSSNVLGYAIQRSSDGGGTWVPLGHFTTTRFFDTTVTAGKTYQYRVSAFNSAGVSAWRTTGIVLTPNALRFDGPVSGSSFGSSFGQNATDTGSALTRGRSGTIVDYFLASPSTSSRVGKSAVTLTPAAETLAPKSFVPGTSPSARLRPPAPAMDTWELSGQLSG
jgi:hypothetical protein